VTPREEYIHLLAGALAAVNATYPKQTHPGVVLEDAKRLALMAVEHVNIQFPPERGYEFREVDPDELPEWNKGFNPIK